MKMLLAVAVSVAVLAVFAQTAVAQLAVGTTYGFETPALSAMNGNPSYSYATVTPGLTQGGYTNPSPTVNANYEPFTYTPSTFAGLCTQTGPFAPQVQTTNAAFGNQFGFLQVYIPGGSGTTVSMQTTLTGLTVGNSYQVSYFYAPRGGVTAAQLVAAGATVTANILTSNVITNTDTRIILSPTGFLNANFNFVAAAATVALRFTFTAPNAASNGGDFSVDFENILVSLMSGISGDPQFNGLLGQSFQVHGVDQQVYNLISSVDLQANARFVFLNEGKCPAAIKTACWSHPGSYLGAVGIKQRLQEGHIEELALTSGPAATGFSQITINGVPVEIGTDYVVCGKNANATKSCFSTKVVSSHLVKVRTPTFNFELVNSDMFINQRLSLNVPISEINAHGLLGQTSKNKLYTGNSIKYIQGEVDDYSIDEDDLFGDCFDYNMFHE